MGIPVITNSGVGDVTEIVTKYNAGYIINDFSDESFNRIIEKIKEGNPFDKALIRAGAKNFYALKDSFQATYILDSVIKNFTSFPDVVEEAQIELESIKVKEAQTNSSIQN